MRFIKTFAILLFPIILLLTSCENNIPVEFIIEEEESEYDGMYHLEDAEYFIINLQTVHEMEETPNQIWPQQGVWGIVPPDILDHVRLNKGDILRLDNLEPGKYDLWGTAYGQQPYNDEPIMVGDITGKSDKMDDAGHIIVDDFSPTIVKLVFTCNIH
ncbi:MAG: hypothetical protein J5857_09880 [Treponema sp.]|nr:hypothetical protein [Treponema sp.]